VEALGLVEVGLHSFLASALEIDKYIPEFSNTLSLRSSLNVSDQVYTHTKQHEKL
jgi:hypothetical protein